MKLSFNIFRIVVIDDENTNVVTAGAIVTVTVTLTRNNMSQLFGDSSAKLKDEIRYVLFRNIKARIQNIFNYLHPFLTSSNIINTKLLL